MNELQKDIRSDAFKKSIRFIHSHCMKHECFIKNRNYYIDHKTIYKETTKLKST